MDKVYELIRNLESPNREFSPVPFWFLNDEFSDDEIIRQMEDFNSKGVHGVVLHPRIGIPESIEYLSDKFMHTIETAVKTAARLDMRIVLYDEGMYPSGSARMASSIPASFAAFCAISSVMVGSESVIWSSTVPGTREKCCSTQPMHARRSWSGIAETFTPPMVISPFSG